MPQTSPDIPSTKAVRDSRQDILDRDEAVRSAFSGTTFPSTNLVVGMFCFRTDLGQVYELTATSPVTWTRIPLGVPVPVGQGGTGATDAAVARTNLGLAALAVKNTVAAADIDNAAITSAKIADGNVTTTKIPDGQISAAKIIDAAVTSAKIADNAVTTAKIAAGSITSAKIAAGTIYLSGDIVAMRVGNPAEGALYLGNSDNYSRSLVYAGGQYVLTNSPLNVSYIKGGSDDAGALKSYNSGNIINFGWQNDSVFYRVDDVVHRNICTQTNAKDLALAGGTGAPTGVSLNVFTMSGTLFGIFADQSSDERLKFDIRPTPIDALETLKNIEVCSYSLHPQIAAWFAAEGKDNDTSAQLAQGAEPVAVPIGFIAQQLQQHVPDAVRVLEQTPGISPLPTDLHTLTLPALMPYLVRAIQQQQAEIARLRADLSTLTAQVA